MRGMSGLFRAVPVRRQRHGPAGPRAGALRVLIRLTLLALAACVAAGGAGPSCNLVAGWTPQGAPRAYTAENLFEYMDGNAEGYLLYGFIRMQGVTCEKD